MSAQSLWPNLPKPPYYMRRVVLLETALSHKHQLHPKSPINFKSEKKTRIEWGNMTRSCRKCGYFVSPPTSSEKHRGYCLLFKLKNIDIEESRREPKIIDGEEEAVADGCEGYINTADYFK